MLPMKVGVICNVHGVSQRAVLSVTNGGVEVICNVQGCYRRNRITSYHVTSNSTLLQTGIIISVISDKIQGN